MSTESKKRGVFRWFWSVIGKILWTILSVLVKLAAALGSRWARKKLDEHDRRRSAQGKRRLLGRRR